MINALFLAASLSLPPTLPPASPNRPVAQIDLQRYLGTWHEVARLPLFFQRKCVRRTTATYGLRADGRLTVRNACETRDGGGIEVNGVARTTGTPGALEVQFAPEWLPFGWGDYWVIDLDPDYQWAVVGGPRRSALWMLSRDPAPPAALIDRLRQRAEARGYDLDELIVASAP